MYYEFEECINKYPKGQCYFHNQTHRMMQNSGFNGSSADQRLCLCYISLVVRKPVFGVLTRSDTNQAVQLLKMARGLKFWI